MAPLGNGAKDQQLRSPGSSNFEPHPMSSFNRAGEAGACQSVVMPQVFVLGSIYQHKPCWGFLVLSHRHVSARASCLRSSGFSKVPVSFAHVECTDDKVISSCLRLRKTWFVCFLFGSSGYEFEEGTTSKVFGGHESPHQGLMSTKG